MARLERESRQSQVVRWTAIIIAVFILVGGSVVLFLDGTLAFGTFNIDYLIRNRPVVRIEGEEATMHDFQVNVRLQRQGLLNQYLTYYQYSLYGLDVSQQLKQIEFQLSPDNA